MTGTGKKNKNAERWISAVWTCEGQKTKMKVQRTFFEMQNDYSCGMCWGDCSGSCNLGFLTSVATQNDLQKVRRPLVKVTFNSLVQCCRGSTQVHHDRRSPRPWVFGQVTASFCHHYWLNHFKHNNATQFWVFGNFLLSQTPPCQKATRAPLARHSAMIRAREGHREDWGLVPPRPKGRQPPSPRPCLPSLALPTTRLIPAGQVGSGHEEDHQGHPPQHVDTNIASCLDNVSF